MKKIRTILNLILLGIIMLILTNENVSKCIDDAVLLENRNPGYYEFLSNSSINYVSKNVLDESNDNLLTNVMQTTDFRNSGFEILVHEDGTFTFTGRYTGKDPFYIYPIEIGNLKPGDYIFSDGGASKDNGIQMRIFGVKELPDGEYEYGNVWKPSDGLFHWDDTEYDYAAINVIIYPGFYAKDLRFYPMLCAANKSAIPYQNALRKLKTLSENQNKEDYLSYLEIKIEKKELSKLKKSDWRILCNQARYQNKVDWICVNLGDGTGIQIQDNNLDRVIQGEVDNVGRVKNSLY